LGCPVVEPNPKGIRAYYLEPHNAINWMPHIFYFRGSIGAGAFGFVILGLIFLFLMEKESA